MTEVMMKTMMTRGAERQASMPFLLMLFLSLLQSARAPMFVHCVSKLRTQDSDDLCQEYCKQKLCLREFCECHEGEAVNTCATLDFGSKVTINETSTPGTVIFSINVTGTETWNYTLASAGSVMGSVWNLLRNYLVLVRNGSKYDMVINTTPDLEDIYFQTGLKLSVLTLQLTCHTAPQQAKVQEVFLIISPVNEYAPEFSPLPLYQTVPEDTPVPSVIYRLKDHAIDRDVNPLTNELAYFQMLDYLPDPQQDFRAYFSMQNFGEGIITLIKAFDFEALLSTNSTQFFLNVSARDSAGVTTCETLTIEVLDVDDLPPEFQDSRCPEVTVKSKPCLVSYEATVPVNFQGQIIKIQPGLVQAKDMDTFDNPMLYSLELGPGELQTTLDKFEIDNTSALICVRSPLQQETDINLVIVAQEQTITGPGRSTQAPLHVVVDNGPVSVSTESRDNTTEKTLSGTNDTLHLIISISLGILCVILLAALLAVCYLLKQNAQSSVKVGPHPSPRNSLDSSGLVPELKGPLPVAEEGREIIHTNFTTNKSESRDERTGDRNKSARTDGSEDVILLSSQANLRASANHNSFLNHRIGSDLGRESAPARSQRQSSKSVAKEQPRPHTISASYRREHEHHDGGIQYHSDTLSAIQNEKYTEWELDDQKAGENKVRQQRDEPKGVRDSEHTEDQYSGNERKEDIGNSLTTHNSLTPEPVYRSSVVTPTSEDCKNDETTDPSNNPISSDLSPEYMGVLKPKLCPAANSDVLTLLPASGATDEQSTTDGISVTVPPVDWDRQISEIRAESRKEQSVGGMTAGDRDRYTTNSRTNEHISLTNHSQEARVPFPPKPETPSKQRNSGDEGEVEQPDNGVQNITEIFNDNHSRNVGHMMEMADETLSRSGTSSSTLNRKKKKKKKKIMRAHHTLPEIYDLTEEATSNNHVPPPPRLTIKTPSFYQGRLGNLTESMAPLHTPQPPSDNYPDQHRRAKSPTNYPDEQSSGTSSKTPSNDHRTVAQSSGRKSVVDWSHRQPYLRPHHHLDQQQQQEQPWTHFQPQQRQRGRRYAKAQQPRRQPSPEAEASLISHYQQPLSHAENVPGFPTVNSGTENDTQK